MSNPITLTGGQTVFGSAVDNTGTDNFIVYGPNNTIVEGGGNLIVTGGQSYTYGWDTATNVLLGAASYTTDYITLDGAYNTVATTYPLYGSTVSVYVTGYGLAAKYQGYNTVNLDNEYGTTKVSLNGKYNSITLNGDATNTVTTGSGYATVVIGGTSYNQNNYVDDDLFGYNSTVKLAGTYNKVYGGDENFTITGAGNSSTITLGDGNNSITATGLNDVITVGGGTNVIKAGKGYDTVNIVGQDGTNAVSYVEDGDDPILANPTDTVTIAGAYDTVNATYENVVVNGSGATGYASVNLGNGNNQVTLAGDNNTVNVGAGTNNIALTGNYNTVNVTDPYGYGTDNVSLNNGYGDTVNFDHAGGSVSGSGTGTTTVTQNAYAYARLTINLHYGTGLISIGNGNDYVNANGAYTSVTAGYGNDTVYANGDYSTVTLGNGNDYVAANGMNSTVTLGSGNDTVYAKGSGSLVTINASSTSTDSITVGSNNNAVNVTNGIDSINGVANDHFYLNGLQPGSNVILSGSGNQVFLGSDSDVRVQLNYAQPNNTITVQANTDNTYHGTVEISNFNANDFVDLQGLVGGVDGHALNSYLEVLKNIQAGPVSDTLQLAGGGSIVFDGTPTFSAAEFVFTTNTGPVHA